MRTETREVLLAMRQYGLTHDAGKTDRVQRLRNLEPDSAEVLSVLVQAAHCERVLELGTSNGYSTVALADALLATGGRLTTVEIDPVRSNQAADNLARAGLTHVVELRVQDASDALRTSEDNSWDMVFLDAERPEYVAYWPDLRRTIKRGGVLAVDNVLSHADQVAEFRAIVDADSSCHAAVVPTGAGVLLAILA